VPNLESKHLSQIEVGYQVDVPLGNRVAKGWVINIFRGTDLPPDLAKIISNESSPKSTLNTNKNASKRKKAFTLKQIISAFPCFSPSDYKLFSWMSEYYSCPIAEVINNAVPIKSLGSPIKNISLTDSFFEFTKESSNWLQSIQQKAPLQAKLLQTLIDSKNSSTLSKLLTLGSSTRSALKTLEKKGWIETKNTTNEDIPIPPQNNNQSFQQASKHALTDAQVRAVNKVIDKIQLKKFAPILLHGVTGSGKTEVYLRSIEHVLLNNGNVLLVVPEIALTPQLVDQFRHRLNSNVAVLHSQVGATIRWSYWSQIYAGNIHVALGARSAIFAPFSKLDLIIVDEEHENSFKQNDALRYNGRDVAIMKAHFHKCPVLLGSATPSFESLVNALDKKYSFIEMPQRATTRPLPSIEVVDLCSFKKSEFPSQNISPPLYSAIKNTLDLRQQIIILYNRRGFSSYLQCSTCNEVALCSQCSVALTYHKNKDKCLCHYCGAILPPPSLCSRCRDPLTTSLESSNEKSAKNQESPIGKLEHRGGGTERVVDELKELFLEAKILRMDRDTVSKKGAYREILGKMRSKEADILVGTQMIAKGHDLPGVTLVGIMDADVGMHIPDFRASERTFQLITQAAGRAGRGSEAGRVIVQTHEPNHPTIVAAATGRFKAFARYELEYRKELNYPPFGRLMRIVTSCPDRTLSASFAKQTFLQSSAIAKELIDTSSLDKPNKSLPSIIGPAPAPHEKLRNRYRWHILVKSQSARFLSLLASNLLAWHTKNKGKNDLRLTTDIDPVEML
jgi:primosomal protein N' (replication factor Y)